MYISIRFNFHNIQSSLFSSYYFQCYKLLTLFYIFYYRIGSRKDKIEHILYTIVITTTTLTIIINVYRWREIIEKICENI